MSLPYVDYCKYVFGQVHDPLAELTSLNGIIFDEAIRLAYLYPDNQWAERFFWTHFILNPQHTAFLGYLPPDYQEFIQYFRTPGHLHVSPACEDIINGPTNQERRRELCRFWLNLPEQGLCRWVSTLQASHGDICGVLLRSWNDTPKEQVLGQCLLERVSSQAALCCQDIIIAWESVAQLNLPLCKHYILARLLNVDPAYEIDTVNEIMTCYTKQNFLEGILQTLLQTPNISFRSVAGVSVWL